MGVGQRGGDLRPAGDRLLRRQGFLGGNLLEGAALDILHDDVELPVAAADVVDGADVGVVEGGGEARLLEQPVVGLFVGAQPLGQHLDRHLAAEPRVLGQVDLAHPALAEAADDLEALEDRADLHGVRPLAP